MDFFKKRVRGFQEKKLKEILTNIQFHQEMKQKAEQKLETIQSEENAKKLREEILFNKKMIEIWQRNEIKLRKQMSDLEY